MAAANAGAMEKKRHYTRDSNGPHLYLWLTQDGEADTPASHAHGWGVNDLINEAKAQAGKHIGGSQAAEMIAEAQAAIDAIGILYD
jgi:hypothetical protein